MTQNLGGLRVSPNANKGSTYISLSTREQEQSNFVVGYSRNRNSGPLSNAGGANPHGVENPDSPKLKLGADTEDSICGANSGPPVGGKTWGCSIENGADQ